MHNFVIEKRLKHYFSATAPFLASFSYTIRVALLSSQSRMFGIYSGFNSGIDTF